MAYLVENECNGNPVALSNIANDKIEMYKNDFRRPP